MRLAVLADVHANLAALEAVLAAVDQAQVDRVVCLGDLVGYNAEPAECVARIRASADVVVAGNHDRCVTLAGDTRGINEIALAVNEWTRAQLDPDLLHYLASLPARHIEPDRFVAVHGCFLNDTHVNGYVTGTMLQANLEALVARAEWPHIGFCGHTHMPMCGWFVGPSAIESSLASPVQWPASAKAVLVNPGSVGQPRDGDLRASFAIVDLAERSAEVRRVAYDIERSVAAIARAGLPDVLGKRLREGR
jgi:predicted phosphodiesterase